MDDLIAPRVGFSWDMRGDGSTKLFGNAGRYYLPVTNNINVNFAGGLTDESFAFHSVKLGTGAPVNVRYLIGFNLFCHTSWVLGGLLGAVCAQYAAHLIKYQLDYALTAMMLYVLVSLCNTRNKLIAAAAAVVCMGALSLVGSSPFNVFIATFVGCGVGVCLTKRS